MCPVSRPTLRPLINRRTPSHSRKPPAQCFFTAHMPRARSWIVRNVDEVGHADILSADERVQIQKWVDAGVAAREQKKNRKKKVKDDDDAAAAMSDGDEAEAEPEEEEEEVRALTLDLNGGSRR
jgi:hypothetical protein